MNPPAHHLVVRRQESSIDRCGLAKARLHQRPGKRNAGAVGQRVGHHLTRCLDTLRTARTGRSRRRDPSCGHGHHDGLGRLVGDLHHQTSAVVGNHVDALHHIASRHCHFGLHHGRAIDALLANARRGTRVMPLVAGRQQPTAALAAPTIGVRYTGCIHHGAPRAMQSNANPLI